MTQLVIFHLNYITEFGVLLTKEHVHKLTRLVILGSCESR